MDDKVLVNMKQEGQRSMAEFQAKNAIRDQASKARRLMANKSYTGLCVAVTFPFGYMLVNNMFQMNQLRGGIGTAVAALFTRQGKWYRQIYAKEEYAKHMEEREYEANLFT